MSGPDSSDGPGGIVRVVRGEPRAEELAALLVVLRALAGAVAPPAAAPSRAAPWARLAAGVPAAAWLARPRPGWRTP
ncbi:acyl-CoA carboxylase epsilon subunit [Streptomyces sp. NPDC047108]|uniref:acyl-CoA carboxylase epsilon subunit n=1 Tax=Streptomyces sp. NPDC047108 TaxID=3155025 RepID=UPI0033E66F04